MMRAASLFAAIVLASPVWAQTDSRAARTAMQDAYREWREADPNLEADAAVSPSAMGVRSERVAAAANKYFAARQRYFDALDSQMETEARSLTPASAADSGLSPLSTDAFLRAELGSVDKNLALVPNDSDPGFQELRRAWERERAAVVALQSLAANAARTSQPAQAQATAHDPTRPAREHYSELAGQLKQESKETERVGMAWASYYRALADGARAVPNLGPAEPRRLAETPAALAAPPPSAVPAPRAVNTSTENARPVNEPAVATRTVTTGVSAPKTPPVSAEAPPESAPAPAPIALRSSAPGLPPAARYVGAWVYPTVGEHYHGAHPTAVDLIVREESGRLVGTFSAQFQVAPGTKADPLVQFSFSGPYLSARQQALAVVGTAGTLELIPATALNLLEVHFQTPMQTGKITQGNFFLIRK